MIYLCFQLFKLAVGCCFLRSAYLMNIFTLFNDNAHSFLAFTLFPQDFFIRSFPLGEWETSSYSHLHTHGFPPLFQFSKQALVYLFDSDCFHVKISKNAKQMFKKGIYGWFYKSMSCETHTEWQNFSKFTWLDRL